MRKIIILIITMAAIAISTFGCYVWYIINTPANKATILFYYKNIDKDTLKQNAAKFLLDNMQYHFSRNNMSETDNRWEQWRAESDAILLDLQAKYGFNAIPRNVIDSIRTIRDSVLLNFMPKEVYFTNYLHCDTDFITTKFLIEHINNAFNVWRDNKHAKKLSFEEFKEQILPYTPLQGYSTINTGKRLNEIFSPMLCMDSAKTLTECIQRYNHTIGNLRNLNGQNRRKTAAGLYDMYVHGVHDCTDIAVWGCNILRACGIPAFVENVIGYRDFVGKHYHCSAYDADSGKLRPFNAESSLPGNFSFENPKCLNVYRHMYAVQKNTPYFIRKKGEVIPAELTNPCIKDVTSEYRNVYKVSLPCDSHLPNKLAYLATFNAQNGIKVTTWGVVDSITNRVTFNNALPNILYIPVFYTKKGYKSFSSPFYLTVKDRTAKINHVPGINNDSTTTTLCLTRKFPRKEKMKQVAEGLVGGQFLGSKSYDFGKADVLYTIDAAPLPAFKEYKFKKTGIYKYYRFQAPKNYPYANISHLEWITNKYYGYKNTNDAARVHCLNHKETLHLCNDTQKVKLLDKNRNRMTWAKEYDGNMQTAPGAYPNITLTLDEPQIVTAVRFAPLNADNGIKSGNVYELFYWNNGWHSCGKRVAKYEFIEFEKVPANKLYWLRNRTEGKEEMPFTMVNGKQVFIYDEIINH